MVPSNIFCRVSHEMNVSHEIMKGLTSAERQKVESPVLLVASGLAVLLDMLHRRLLASIELQADLAGEPLKTGWILDQLVLDNFLLEFLLLETDPSKVLTRLLDVDDTDIAWHSDDKNPVCVSAEMTVPTVLIVLEVALTHWAPLKAFLRVDICLDMRFEVGARFRRRSWCNRSKPRLKLDACSRHLN